VFNFYTNECPPNF
jgi:WD40 repeat protein